MKHFTRILIYAAIATIASFAGYSNLSAHTISSDTTSFYIIKLHKEIDASSARMFTDALREAEKQNADYCILNLNTYGGALDAADSIRSAIIRTPIPVISFINIQAASAGALISIACDSIYMTNGSSIGAATVVDGSGNVLPDK
ncbi:MAG: ATP-dependent Clp protease proteolytic subunit [Bacteroidales bacterium]|nr:ATP-dependent Clp protease proteolytic subunit [Bacteroidales bacterium]